MDKHNEDELDEDIMAMICNISCQDHCLDEKNRCRFRHRGIISDFKKTILSHKKKELMDEINDLKTKERSTNKEAEHQRVVWNTAIANVEEIIDEVMGG